GGGAERAPVEEGGARAARGGLGRAEDGPGDEPGGDVVRGAGDQAIAADAGLDGIADVADNVRERAPTKPRRDEQAGDHLARARGEERRGAYAIGGGEPQDDLTVECNLGGEGEAAKLRAGSIKEKRKPTIAALSRTHPMPADGG